MTNRINAAGRGVPSLNLLDFLRSKVLLLVLGAATASGSGCGSASGPATALDPAAAAAAALRDYDSNSDGTIDSNELNASLALMEGLSRVDTNTDGNLTVDEIEARLRHYAMLSEFIAGEVQVIRGRRPIEGAAIVFTPEPFMGDRFPTYQGTTGSSGTTVMQADPPTPGVAVGFYRVTINLPDGERIERGVEIADDGPNANRLTFEL